MGLFDKLFGAKNTPASAAPQTMAIDMSKHTENLNSVLLDMSKGSKTNLSNHTARVAVCMDYSGSMGNMFQGGGVQDVITRLLPIALKFDDNGELESWLFSNGCERLEPVTASNYKNYVMDVMTESGMYMGGTEYAPVLEDVVEYYKGKYPSETPAFVIFITDGDNSDTARTDRIVRELSEYNMFVQFVGIGTGSNFDYLRKLDNLSGRKHDNTGFISVKTINKMDDQQLYTEILRQYKDWLNKKG